MNLSEIDNFYLQKDEPLRGCLLALREMILAQNEHVTAAWKYGMPFFRYKGKMFCYLWVHKKHCQPYIGFVEGKHLDHPELVIEKRSRMKIILIDPLGDLPVEKIKTLLHRAIELYETGVVKI